MRRLRLLFSLSAMVVGCILAAPAAAATPPDAGAIDNYLATKGSPMAGQGGAFVASGSTWRLDPRLLVAIAGAESSFGQITCAQNNAWGWGCPNNPYNFATWAEGIDAVARGLRSNYLDDGLTTVAAIHSRYAPIGAANDPTGLNSAWTINVTRFLTELGGDPLDLDMDGVSGASAMSEARVGGLMVPLPGPHPYAASAPKGSKVSRGSISVPAGGGATLRVRMENTGDRDWTDATVRLRRLDGSARVQSAPYARLLRRVPPGEIAEFEVVLTGAGLRSSVEQTAWQIETPTGRIGPRLTRTVTVQRERLAYAVESIDAPERAAAGKAFRVVVRVRNAGSETWRRDEPGGTVLGITAQHGAHLSGPAWPGTEVPARMLEREVAPGEQATFAFLAAFPEAATAGTTAELALAIVSQEQWATGTPIGLSVVSEGSAP